MRKGLTVCAGGACSVLQAGPCSPGTVSAAALSPLHSDLLKPWERTLLLYAEVKSDYGQSAHKVLGE